MQVLTKKTIKKILTDTSHVLDVEDFDLIEELDGLARRVSGVSKRERRLLNSPFELCGINFYPLTVAKSLWFAEKVEEWEVESVYQETLLFWLLTLPLTTEALDQYVDRKTVEKSAKRLSRRLHCSHKDIADVFSKCVGVREGKVTSETEVEADYGGTIACLIKEYGGSPDQWLYETPVDKMASLFDQYEKRIIAEENAQNRSASKKGVAVAPRMTNGMMALKRFHQKAQELKEKWSALDGE